ncbi:conserved hypothetical protein [Mesorhizobium plurifarium]|uniref:Uncharacterized protein n=1 Tax=Mesorhizobium plurifarium TaxID=69974 RepID=A0A0K2VYW3_MESPL|nr:conserved hypothetical protein [Mesorhizobium plurifarium]
MIFCHKAESISSGFADEPQDEDAQPVDFALANNWSKDLVLTKLSSEIAVTDIERLRSWVDVAVLFAKVVPARKRRFQFKMSAFMCDFACSLRHNFCRACDLNRRAASERHHSQEARRGRMFDVAAFRISSPQCHADAGHSRFAAA